MLSPGNSYYYGTDSGGTKGWHSLPSAQIEIDGVLQGVAETLDFDSFKQAHDLMESSQHIGKIVLEL